MKIILLRHGQPDFSIRWLNPADGANSVLERYAASRVTTSRVTTGLPPHMQGLGTEVDVCVTSTLPRSIESARILGFDELITSELFNESELPHPNRLLFPLPWGLFLFIYRILWFFGYKNNSAGRFKDRMRAIEGCKFLIDLAKMNAQVLLVGHGIMNRMICSELKKAGWQIDKKNGTSYWSSISLSKTALANNALSNNALSNKRV